MLAAVVLAASALPLAATGPATADSSPPAPAPAVTPSSADVIEPFGRRYGATLYGDFTTAGASVMRCAGAPAPCAADGRVPPGAKPPVRERVDPAGLSSGGKAPAYGSGTAGIRVPAGAKVAYARLFWGGHDGTYETADGRGLRRCAASGADAVPSPGEPATTAPLLRVGTGRAAPVPVDSMVTDPAKTQGPRFYTGESDVTAAFAGVSGPGTTPVAVGNVWAANGAGCAAGWSLTVVYAFPGPDAKAGRERRDVRVYGGHVLQRPASRVTTLTVDGLAGLTGRGGTVRAAVTAFGGVAPGDRFLVDGRSAAASRTGLPAVLPGLDVGTFELPEGTVARDATSVELSFAPDGDTYVPAALALSVPAPDTAATGAAGAPAARPGPATETAPAPATPAASTTPARSGTPAASPTPAPSAPPGPTRTAYPAGSGIAPALPGAPGPGARDVPPSAGGTMASTGGDGERLWLLGGLALALAGTGLVAKAALRGRRDL
ncbi:MULTISPECIES: hypothetical protein [unclassified Streptomyces]|uniref:hypothetical protein n=1 Tax=unclassified Streptomyces TaxID=2593676 RepID=UPI0036BEAD5D